MKRLTLVFLNRFTHVSVSVHTCVFTHRSPQEADACCPRSDACHTSLTSLRWICLVFFDGLVAPSLLLLSIYRSPQLASLIIVVKKIGVVWQSAGIDVEGMYRQIAHPFVAFHHFWGALCHKTKNIVFKLLKLKVAV